MLVAAGAPAAAQEPGLELADTAVLAAPGLHESSGIVVSARRPGIIWTINDSGNRPLLFATDSSGRDRGFVRVRGANLVDWEDLSAGPCPGSSEACLYIGDIGDNNRRRRRVVVYVLPEPDAPSAPGDTLREIVVRDSIVLRYPDRAHDAEALAITPDRWLLIVTKDLGDDPGLYRAPIDSTGGVRTLEFLGDLPIATGFVRGRLVTGSAVSPDGRLLAVRTYISLHLFRLSAGGRTTPLLPRNGIPIPVVETQGEAIAFDGNERLVLTSERGRSGHAIISRLRLRRTSGP